MPQRRVVIGSRFISAVVLTAAALSLLGMTGCNIGGVEQDTIQVTYEAEPVVQTRNATATPSAPQNATTPTPVNRPSVVPNSINRDLDVVTVLGKDAIPAIREPEFVTASDAEAWMNADEPIIGVELDGDVRAYPTAMLSRHEIVNDTVGGAPIAVTW